MALDPSLELRRLNQQLAVASAPRRRYTEAIGLAIRVETSRSNAGARTGRSMYTPALPQPGGAVPSDG